MLKRFLTVRRVIALGAIATGVGVASAAFAPAALLPLPTTLADFQQPGTQPLDIVDPIVASGTCSGCHGFFDDNIEPYRLWAASMMGQSSRDPIFWAAVAIANQDASESGELCLRCHTPGAWLAGRSTPADGSALDAGLGDFDGVTCHFCHRMVDPVYDAAENPPADAGILSNLGVAAPFNEVHTGQYVVDEFDVRRGPFELSPGFFFHQWAESPFHRESLMCGTCHDVSNPQLSLQMTGPNAGTYQLNNTNMPHPTHAKTSEFPVERTFSEWASSVYAQTEIDTGGRFGGDKPQVASCQDCHMPDTLGAAAMDGIGAVVRPDQPLHHFNGANSWVLRAINSLYPQFETGLTDQSIDDSIARNVQMLQDAADLYAFEDSGQLVVRVVNQTGHKLPTGYGEGRRMWINVQFFNGATMIAERGDYDFFDEPGPGMGTAELSTGDTKVYEIHQGLDAVQAAATGLPVGDSFHFVLNNEITSDNRIPPRGYNIATFDAVQAAPVGYVYDHQQHWDDTLYTIPAGTTDVVVNLYHQTTSKEYIEFLRDENTTNSAGMDAYTLWELFGKSDPVLMQSVNVDLSNVACPEPIKYGLGRLNSLGRYAWIDYNGTPSLAANNFELTITGGIPFTWASAFWGPAPANIPFFGGTLHVFMPNRGAIFNLDSNGDWTVPVPITSGMVGTTRYYQILYRDTGLPETVALTDGLRIDFCD